MKTRRHISAVVFTHSTPRRSETSASSKLANVVSQFPPPPPPHTCAAASLSLIIHDLPLLTHRHLLSYPAYILRAISYLWMCILAVFGRAVGLAVVMPPCRILQILRPKNIQALPPANAILAYHYYYYDTATRICSPLALTSFLCRTLPLLVL
ncbi:uncharacterized protein K460DRAFT_1985 [Cucurbitaria berberidis CBS 394.84]|uniref:Uncharacterized protein n=1 Tax=Cucurbitaria berberidis CBS 394.84 TaxID=1168544 RepID=A0A9P4LBK0_9PLEO|nr:uncharacterized protein K460DRAFT_1985 [Cucurbitaria berberidis CBS 394.84]KAF1849681.1 hypothetical protein K460DRAFT_1985 [Cucurbitaria berberidis CBS 394.84]